MKIIKKSELTVQLTPEEISEAIVRHIAYTQGYSLSEEHYSHVTYVCNSDNDTVLSATLKTVHIQRKQDAAESDAAESDAAERNEG